MQEPDNTVFQQRLNSLFNRSNEESTYTGEQLAEMHLQTTGVLFQVEHALPQNDTARHYINRCRWTLNINPFNSALHHEISLLILQLLAKYII